MRSISLLHRYMNQIVFLDTSGKPIDNAIYSAQVSRRNHLNDQHRLATGALFRLTSRLNSALYINDKRLTVFDKRCIMENLKSSTGESATNKHRCEECGKGFKQKQHLFRHHRTIHNNQGGYECQICHVKLNRKDNYDRHMKSHELKRKLDCPPDDLSDAKRKCTEENKQNVPQNMETVMDTDPPADVGTCIWCTQMKTLLPGKKFCKSCGDGGRECR